MITVADVVLIVDLIAEVASLPADGVTIPQWLVLVWLGILGGVVGSFVNVVVYRVPRGMSIVHPPSHCPHCLRTIRWYDNVPVLGWLWLRGRCRDCRAAISMRYPLVEALFAALFAGLAFVDVYTSTAEAWRQELAIPTTASWFMYGYQLLLVSTLLVAALIEFDGFAQPRKLLVGCALVGFAAPLIWPGLRPLAWTGAASAAPRTTEAMLTGLAGAGSGLVLGCMAWSVLGSPVNKAADRTASVLALVLVGTFVGWQLVGIVAPAAVALFCLMALCAQWWWQTAPRAGFRCALAASVMLLVFVWPYVDRAIALLARQSALRLLVVASLLIAALSVASQFGIQYLRRRRDLPTRGH